MIFPHNILTYFNLNFFIGNILGLRYGTLVQPPESYIDEGNNIKNIPITTTSEIEEEKLDKKSVKEKDKKKGGKVDKKTKEKEREEMLALEDEMSRAIIENEIKKERELKEEEEKEEKEREEAEKKKNNIIQNLDLKNATFFCHCQDDVRIVSFLGPCGGVSLRKPDKCGTVCLLCVYPTGLQVLLCSNGVVKCESPVQSILNNISGGNTDSSHGNNNNTSRSNNSNHSSSRSSSCSSSGRVIHCTDPSTSVHEISRLICAGGSALRKLLYGPYSQDILNSDGTRTLVRRVEGGGIHPPTSSSSTDVVAVADIISNSNNSSKSSSNNDSNTDNITIYNSHNNDDKNTNNTKNNTNNSSDTNNDINNPTIKIGQGFHSKILSNAPINWQYIRLDNQGKVLFFSCFPGSVPESKGVQLGVQKFEESNPMENNGINGMKNRNESKSENNQNNGASNSISNSSSNDTKNSIKIKNDYINIMRVSIDAETHAKVCMCSVCNF